MRDPLKSQVRWFLLKLRHIRKDTNKTATFISDINFDLSIIVKNKLFNIITKDSRQAFQEAMEVVEDMLLNIKNDNEFLRKFNIDASHLSWNWIIEGEALFIISGFQTGLLNDYLKYRILADERPFSLTKNARDQLTIAVYGENTGKKILSGDQSLLLSYFLKHTNGTLITYSTLFEQIKKAMRHGGQYYTTMYPTEDSKRDFIVETVYNLKRTLQEIGEDYDIDVDELIKNSKTNGYICQI